MNIKKIIALILAFIFVVPCYAAFAQQDEAAITTSESFDEAYGLLDALGFLSEDIKSIELSSGITRAQFAHLVACVRGVSATAMHDGSYGFIDVQPDHMYATEIYNLRKMGVISGANEYQYLPDNHITYNEASKILVKIMGYELKAEMAYGGYPLGYVRVMDNLDIMEGEFSGDSDVTLEDAIVMCFNAALVDVVEMIAIKNNEPIYQSVDGKNTLAMYHDVYVAEGIMNDNGYTALAGSSSTSLDKIRVGDVAIKKGDVSAEGSIGAIVRAYYHYDGNVRTLKYVFETEQNEILYVDADDITNNAQGSAYKLYYYNESEKEKLAELDPLGDFVYNGKAYVDFVKEDLHIKNGTLKFINNDDDKYYDVVLVTAYSSFPVSYVDTQGEKIYGKYGEYTEYEDCDSFAVYNSNGLLITPAEIKAGDVVSTSASKDNKVIAVYVSTEKVTGEITKTYDEDGVTYYGIGEKYYSYSANYAAAVAANKNHECKTLEIGSTYTFSFDINGDICDVELGDSTGVKYAYLIDAAKDTENMKEILKFKLFMQDGTIAEVQAAKKVNLNGTDVDGVDLLTKDARFYRGKSYVKPQLVQVKVNTKNELTDINLYAEPNSYGYNADEFSKDKTLNNSKYRGGNVLSWGGVYQITKDPLIFCVPTSDDFEDDDLQIWTASRLTSGVRYNVEIYDADSALTTDIFLVVTDEAGASYDTCMFTVDEVSRGLNSDGDAVKMISGVSQGAYVSYTEKEKNIIPDDIKPGDVLRIARADKNITAVEKITSLTDNPAPFVKYYDNSSSMYEHDYIVQCGYLYGKSDVAVAITTPDDYVSQYGKIVSHSTNNGTTKVTIWDSGKKEAKAGTLADLIIIDVPEGDGSIAISDNSVKVVAYRRQDYLREIVIIK